MVKFTLAAVRSFLRRHRFAAVRSYLVPCGCFGRHATVWDCQARKHIIEKGRWCAETRAATLLAGYGVAHSLPAAIFLSADMSDGSRSDRPRL